MFKEVYLDNQTVTRPSPVIAEKLIALYREKWGDPCSPHQKGIEAREEITRALDSLAKALGIGEKGHFRLTPGGSEAVFQLLQQYFFEEIRETGRNHLLASELEEATILLPLQRMEELGCAVRLLFVDEKGQLSPKNIEEAIKPKTSLISLSWANALTGVLQPVQEIARLCHAQGVKIHVNASAVVGKIPLHFHELGVDFLSFDGDKIHIPPGIGGLIQRKKPRDLLGHAAPLKALALGVEEELQRLEQTVLEMARLRDTFEAELRYALPDSQILFQEADRLPHVTAVVFPGVMGEALLYALHRRRVYATIGGGPYQRLSSQLQRSGLSEVLSHSAISFSLSHETTEDDLAYAIDAIVSSVRQLATLSYAL